MLITAMRGQIFNCRSFGLIMWQRDEDPTGRTMFLSLRNSVFNSKPLLPLRI